MHERPCSYGKLHLKYSEEFFHNLKGTGLNPDFCKLQVMYCWHGHLKRHNVYRNAAIDLRKISCFFGLLSTMALFINKSNEPQRLQC